jgi:[ribosomal protein S5]-alanine N-acetyltransferase
MKLQLLAFDRTAADAVAGGDHGQFAETPNFTSVAPHVVGVAEAYATLYRRTEAASPWTGYFAFDARSGDLVGSCGFKDACRDGAVEIAYFTFPDFEGRGVGSAMAAGLVAIAGKERAVDRVIAHTLPREGASCRILRRLGFVLLGPVEDLEDGTVWRWQRIGAKKSPE